MADTATEGGAHIPRRESIAGSHFGSGPTRRLRYCRWQQHGECGLPFASGLERRGRRNQPFPGFFRPAAGALKGAVFAAYECNWLLMHAVKAAMTSFSLAPENII